MFSFVLFCFVLMALGVIHAARYKLLLIYTKRIKTFPHVSTLSTHLYINYPKPILIQKREIIKKIHRSRSVKLLFYLDVKGRKMKNIFEPNKCSSVLPRNMKKVVPRFLRNLFLDLGVSCKCEQYSCQ